ncbi:MAG: amidohydrolase [Chloroflexota bacterium]|nr:amidohydrolase [Chloroflexota bacterium]
MGFRESRDGGAITGVVDAHTHIFSPEVVRGRDAFVGRDLWFEQLYADPRALLVTGEDLVRSMDKAGIDRAVVCGFPWHDPGICREHNDYLAEACGASGGRLVWLATVSPGEGAPAGAEVQRAVSLGASGVGELNADAQRFDLMRPANVGPMVDTCVALDLPLMLHATEPVGHVYRGKGTATPDRLLAFLAAYPDLRVVAAHWGGGLPFYELMPEVAAVAARVTYDSAASTYLYRFPVFRTVIDLVGAERVMFGSDFPVLRQDRFLRRVLDLGLSEEDAAALLSGTAHRVYRIPPFPAGAAA